MRGEDYSTGSEAANLGLSEIHRRITHQIGNHLKRTGGEALIIFDEIQKVMPGTLDILMPALEERGFITTVDYELPTFADISSYFYPSSSSTNKPTMPSSSSSSNDHSTMKPVIKRYDTTKCVFVFVSDIGSKIMTKILLKYGDRQDIPIQVLRNEVKEALDQQWDRLRFGKVIKEVVPYLPLEMNHMRDIMTLKLESFSDRLKYKYWLRLYTEPNVIEYLISSEFINYSKYIVKAKPRPVEQSVCENEEVCSNNNNSVLGSEENNNATRTKVFSTWGARALSNAGPLRDLWTLLNRNAQPWQSGIYIGLLLAFYSDID